MSSTARRTTVHWHSASTSSKTSQQLQHRLQQAQMLRRRMASMQRTRVAGHQLGLLSPTPETPTSASDQQPAIP
ncbi:hypothetical protein ACRRTK_023674 [Alexandromys fortis]